MGLLGRNVRAWLWAEGGGGADGGCAAVLLLPPLAYPGCCVCRAPACGNGWAGVVAARWKRAYGRALEFYGSSGICSLGPRK